MPRAKIGDKAPASKDKFLAEEKIDRSLNFHKSVYLTHAAQV